MATNPAAPRRERPSVAVLFLVAALSALVVVAIYEVNGAEPPPRPGEASLDATAPPPAPNVPEPARSPGPPSCARLRQTYLAQCPNDLPGAPPPGAAVPSSAGARTAAEQARAAADLAVWLHPPPEELEELAKRCEVRFEMPAIAENAAPTVSDEDAAALSLDAAERAALQRTLTDLHTNLQDFAVQSVRELGGDLQGATPSLEEALSELQTRPGSGFEAARETVAKERAGRAQPPPSDQRQPPGERLLRLWAGLGDEFERQLATKVGKDRAHQLRTSSSASWMNRFSQSGCRTAAETTSRK